jgi:hypothetical protein
MSTTTTDRPPEDGSHDPRWRRLAELELELARSRSDLKWLLRSRSLATSVTLVAFAKRQIRLRALRSALRSAWGRDGSLDPDLRRDVDRLLRDVPNDQRGMFYLGRRLAFPEIRVGEVGTSPFRSVAPHVQLASNTWEDDVAAGLDFLIIGPDGSAEPNHTVAVAAACRRAGVPVVSLGPSRDQLGGIDDSIAPELQLAVDPTFFNPMGWSVETGNGVALIAHEEGNDEALEFVSRLGDRGIPAEIVSQDRLRSSEDHKQLARRFRLAVVLTRSTRLPTLTLLRVVACGLPTVMVDVPPSIQPLIEGMALAASYDTAVDIAEALMADDQERERLSVRTRREVLWRRSPRALFGQLLQQLDIPVHEPVLSVILPTKRPEFLAAALEEVARQRYRPIDVVVVLHGESFEGFEPPRVEGINPTYIRASADKVVGDVHNIGLARAGGEYIAKMDDDDLYGAWHTIDLLLAIEYSGADLVGKWGCFTYLDQKDVTVSNNKDKQEQFVRHIPAATILARQETLRGIGFRRVPRSIDTHLIRAVTTYGGSVYSTHRYNFIRRRHGEGHAFVRSDDEFIETADSVYPTLRRDIAEV